MPSGFRSSNNNKVVVETKQPGRVRERLGRTSDKTTTTEKSEIDLSKYERGSNTPKDRALFPEGKVRAGVRNQNEVLVENLDNSRTVAEVVNDLKNTKITSTLFTIRTPSELFTKQPGLNGKTPMEVIEASPKSSMTYSRVSGRQMTPLKLLTPILLDSRFRLSGNQGMRDSVTRTILITEHIAMGRQIPSRVEGKAVSWKDISLARQAYVEIQGRIASYESSHKGSLFDSNGRIKYEVANKLVDECSRAIEMIVQQKSSAGASNRMFFESGRIVGASSKSGPRLQVVDVERGKQIILTECNQKSLTSRVSFMSGALSANSKALMAINVGKNGGIELLFSNNFAGLSSPKMIATVLTMLFGKAMFTAEQNVSVSGRIGNSQLLVIKNAKMNLESLKPYLSEMEEFQGTKLFKTILTKLNLIQKLAQMMKHSPSERLEATLGKLMIEALNKLIEELASARKMSSEKASLLKKDFKEASAKKTEVNMREDAGKKNEVSKKADEMKADEVRRRVEEVDPDAKKGKGRKDEESDDGNLVEVEFHDDFAADSIVRRFLVKRNGDIVEAEDFRKGLESSLTSTLLHQLKLAKLSVRVNPPDNEINIEVGQMASGDIKMLMNDYMKSLILHMFAYPGNNVTIRGGGVDLTFTPIEKNDSAKFIVAEFPSGATVAKGKATSSRSAEAMMEMLSGFPGYKVQLRGQEVGLLREFARYSESENGNSIEIVSLKANGKTISTERAKRVLETLTGANPSTMLSLPPLELTFKINDHSAANGQAELETTEINVSVLPPRKIGPETERAEVPAAQVNRNLEAKALYALREYSQIVLTTHNLAGVKIPPEQKRAERRKKAMELLDIFRSNGRNLSGETFDEIKAILQTEGLA